MLDLFDVYEGNGDSTGETLYNKLIQSYAAYDIPLHNIIGFAADGASNMMGEHNSVCSRLRTHLPGITIFRCVAHSLHLCASGAAKTLPRKCEDLIRNVYNYFAQSAKRKYEFQEFQVFCELKPHKLLHACATRWLSLHEAVARLLEQWRPLKLYFSSKIIEERLLAVENIMHALSDPSVFCYLTFLNYVLPHINRVNLVFQSSGPTLHLLHDCISDLYRLLLSSFCNSSSLSNSNLHDINPTDESLYIPEADTYLGSEVHGLFQTPEYYNDKSMMLDIKKRCQVSLIVLCTELRTRFNLSNKLWRLSSYLHPKRVIDMSVRREMPSLRELASEVPRICNYDYQKLDDQWRGIPWHQFPHDMLNPRIDVLRFYKYIISIVNDNGDYKFKCFGQFALKVLSLPTSTDVERLFSKMHLIKRKHRNSLHTNTVKSLITLSECAREQGGCAVYEPNDKMQL